MHRFAALLALALLAPTHHAAAAPAPTAVHVPATLAEATLTLRLPGEALATRALPDGVLTLHLDDARRADLDGDGRPELVALTRERLCPSTHDAPCAEATRLQVFAAPSPTAPLALRASVALPADAQVDGFDLVDGEITVYRTTPAQDDDASERPVAFVEETFTFDGRRLLPVGEPWIQVYDPADGC